MAGDSAEAQARQTKRVEGATRQVSGGADREENGEPSTLPPVFQRALGVTQVAPRVFFYSRGDLTNGSGDREGRRGSQPAGDHGLQPAAEGADAGESGFDETKDG